jgi:tyrosinase
MRHYTRRDFLRMLGGGAAALSVMALTGGCEVMLGEIVNRPVRREISGLSPTDPIIQTYQEAVRAMQALPESDPRNWTRQAEIHLNFCPHNNWFFLPWHRAYLYYFERICRELTGVRDFALPYWNWSANRRLPAAFQGGPANPLFVPDRDVRPRDRARDEFVGPALLESIMQNKNFLLFASGQAAGQRDPSTTGPLEGRPHNYIHGFVGGIMGTYMSPLDPVFWTHHNMIDYCWVEWNANRGHPNTNDPQWAGFVFEDNFVDRGGNPVDVKVSSTFLLPLIAYRYEPTPIGEAPPSAVQRDAQEMMRFLQEGAGVELAFADTFAVQQQVEVRVGEPVTVPIPLPASAIESALAPQAGAATQAERVLITVGDVAQPPSKDFFVRVFVNHPEATAETPLDDPHYAGSFAFFSDAGRAGGHEHATGSAPDFVVDVTETLRTLAEGEEMAAAGEMNVQLVAVPFEERAPEVTSFTLDFLELGLARASVPGAD